MLGEADVIATVAVKDIEPAKKFYGETLGLEQVKEDNGVVTYQSGGSKMVVYAAPTGGSNQASSATWQVKDLKAIVTALAGKGIKFEHYDMPAVTMDGDIHVMGGSQASWFKDPDGNTLALVSGS